MMTIKLAWNRWKQIAKTIGNIQAQIFFILFYFLLLFPVGFGLRLFSDLLGLKTKNNKGSGFSPWIHPSGDLEQIKKPY